MRGRKGEQMLEMLMALALLSITITGMVMYVTSRTDSTPYFSEFYAQDLSAMGEVVAASPGELTVTYDNLKPLGFTYEFKKGLVTVSTEGLNRSAGYGVPESILPTTTTHEDPYFLTFLKKGDRLEVRDASGYLDACDISKPSISGKELRLKVEGPSDAITGVHEVVSRTLPDAGINSEKANLFITFTEGERLTVQRGRDLPGDSEYLSCVLRTQFEAFGEEVVELQANGGDADKKGLRITITLPKDADARLIGQIVGRSVTIYAR